MAALLLAGAALAQAPDQKQGLPRDLVRPAPDRVISDSVISVEDIVERIMSFDKNKDGKITKDELPERMQFLIELGDAGKGGALDRDQVRKLVTARANNGPGFGGGFATGGFGPGGPGGFRTSGTVVGPGPGPGPGFGPRPGPGGRPGVIEGVVDDLKLPGKKKDQAMAVVKAHHDNVKKLIDQAHAELLQKMKAILSEEELQDFVAALDRPRVDNFIIGVGPPDGPTGGKRKIDPPQK
jgi:hypothetical protein